MHKSVNYYQVIATNSNNMQLHGLSLSYNALLLHFYIVIKLN